MESMFSGQTLRMHMRITCLRYSHITNYTRIRCRNQLFGLFSLTHSLAQARTHTHDRLSWGLTTNQPLWVFLCRLPGKGRREIEEIVEEMKERDRGERKINYK